MSFGLLDSLELIRGLGVPIAQVRASGGGARSPLWRQIQADVFGAELVLVNVTEGAAYGAALLAGVGAGDLRHGRRGRAGHRARDRSRRTWAGACCALPGALPDLPVAVRGVGPHLSRDAVLTMERRFRTGDQTWVREHNLAILMQYLWEAGQPVSRARLTQVSGLNKGTVGSLLADLQSWGFVRENGVSDPRPGRPAALMEIDPGGGRVVSVEIGVDFVSAALANLKGELLWSRKVETGYQGAAGSGSGGSGAGAEGTSFRVPASSLESPAAGRAAPAGQARQALMLAQAEALIAEAIQLVVDCGSPLFGIGVGVPGLVDQATGTLLFAPNLGWTNVPLRDLWQPRFGTRVVVANEANAAALGERMLGAAREVDNFLYLSAGVGLGGGLVLDGKLYGGAGGFAGEVGHMTLMPDGPLCNCGNRGCWETLVGPTAIVRRVREAAEQGRVPALMGLPGVAGQSRAIHMTHVLEAAGLGEPTVLEVLEEVGHYLGIGIANLVNAFNPTLVVLGGVLSLAGPFFLPAAEQEVAARALAAPRGAVRIALSAFRFDACIIGSVCLVLRQILNQPSAWRPGGSR